VARCGAFFNILIGCNYNVRLLHSTTTRRLYTAAKKLPVCLRFQQPKAAPDPRSPGIIALSLRQRQIMAQALDQKQKALRNYSHNI
jgi:hypothetical protein